jgi:hypothetical protein
VVDTGDVADAGVDEVAGGRQQGREKRVNGEKWRVGSKCLAPRKWVYAV